MARLARFAGSGLLAIATGASLLVTLDHLGVVELPGCGAESACAAAAASHWGELPGVGWPLAFLGLTYFEAMLVAWVWSRGRLAAPLQWVARLGAAGSIFLLAELALLGHLCGYCLAVHAANLAWVAIVEWGGKSTEQPCPRWPTWRCGLAPFATTFLLTAAILGALESRSLAATEGWVGGLLESSLDEGCASNAAPNAAPDANVGAGRHLRGDAAAEHHLVVYSDYQCPSCRTVHATLLRLMQGRRDLSMSARHFPLCTDCNRHVNATRHPEACRAARVAEAAGHLGGANVFWQAHEWLFDRRGRFSAEQLDAGVATWGLRPDEFRRAMDSDGVTEVIENDIEAAQRAGLRFTPMLLLDGVEIDTNRATEE